MKSFVPCHKGERSHNFPQVHTLYLKMYIVEQVLSPLTESVKLMLKGAEEREREPHWLLLSWAGWLQCGRTCGIVIKPREEHWKPWTQFTREHLRNLQLPFIISPLWTLKFHFSSTILFLKKYAFYSLFFLFLVSVHIENPEILQPIGRRNSLAHLFLSMLWVGGEMRLSRLWQCSEITWGIWMGGYSWV
jgi:hypothetical protein